MVERLTVIFFIILCMLLGFYLILAPWDILFGSWSENYLLNFVTERTGSSNLHKIVNSTWFRGGVTGLGLFNVVLGLLEILRFRESVDLLQRGEG